MRPVDVATTAGDQDGTASGAAWAAAPVPLCVDLDGTLLKTDTLHELLLRLARKRPASFVLVPVWLRGGRASLKRKLASLVPLDPGLLPYDAEFVSFLRAERDRGRSLWLVTGAAREIADGVSRHLGLFEGVLATDGEQNLTGEAKQAALESYFPHGFDYAGNSRADLCIWRAARHAIMVATPPAVARMARSNGNVEREFLRSGVSGRVLLRSLRIHQWTKNVLTFVPLLAAHRLHDRQGLARALLAFVAFGLVASAVYVINDLLDLDSDRSHPRKKHRAIASGALPIRTAVMLVPLLLGIGIPVAALLPRAFGLVLAGYFALTLAYSVVLKRRIVVDVLALAALYTSRIFAGGLATGVPVSLWLAMFSIFFFLSLAFLKRLSELQERSGALPGRGYESIDRDSVLAMGTSSGYLSVLVLALYISSHEISRLYSRPELLWGLCPLLLYWISRLWMLARRGGVQDDPLVFAMKDRATYVLAGVGAIIMMLGARL